MTRPLIIGFTVTDVEHGIVPGAAVVTLRREHQAGDVIRVTVAGSTLGLFEEGAKLGVCFSNWQAELAAA